MKTKSVILAFAAACMAVTAVFAETTAWWHFNGTDGSDATSIPSSVGNHSLTLQTLSGYHAAKFSKVTRGDTAYTLAGDGTRTILNGDVRGSVPLSVVQEADGETTKGLCYTIPAQELFTTNVVDGRVQMEAFTVEIVSRRETGSVAKGSYIGLRTEKNRWVFSFHQFAQGCQWFFDSIYAASGSTHIRTESVYGMAVAANPFPSDGKWHHVAIVYDGAGTVTVYRDFAQIWTASGIILNSYPQTLYIGSRENIGYVYSDNTDTHFTVDEVRISNSALAPSQFARSGFRGFAEGEGGTLAYWTFDAPGKSGEDVGTAYGAINSADGRDDLALCGATSTNSATKGGDVFDTNYDPAGDYQPMFTNDVPSRYVWDAESGEVFNIANDTSVFFKHESAQGANPQSSIGSSLHSVSTIYDVIAASNVTMECFVKPDKTFGAKNSMAMSLVRIANNTAYYNSYGLIYLQNGTRPGAVIPNDKNVPSTKSIADGGWHHVAMNYDFSSGTSRVEKLYVDYQFIGQREEQGALNLGNPANFENLYVAFGAIQGGYAFSGMIDEPRITFGDIGTNHFLRAFSPREDLTGVWLVQTNAVPAGAEWFSPDVPYLVADLGTTALSDKLPPGAVLKIGKTRVSPAKSILFDGSGGVTIPCAALVGTNVFTVEANVCGTGTVFAKRRYDGTSWSVGVDGSGNATVGVNGVDASSSSALADGKWHHVAVAVDLESANTATLYVDGEEAASADASEMISDAGDLVVGGDFIGNMVGVRFSPGIVAPSDFMTVSRPAGFIMIVR